MEEDTEDQPPSPYTSTRPPDRYACRQREDTEGQPLAPYTSTRTPDRYACRQRRNRLFFNAKNDVENLDRQVSHSNNNIMVFHHLVSVSTHAVTQIQVCSKNVQ